ncbi:MAG: O-antigen ligase family protein [Methylococcaceae bacterium]|nr:O-antigen ligase family protein [Methylococcaceae bacterium]
MALFIVAIYTSTALAIIVSALLGLLWILTARFTLLPSLMSTSSVAVWASVLYLCFIAGLAYGDVSSDEAFSTLRKYRELLFIPILSCFFTNERYRIFAWKAFLIASIFTLLSSYLMDFGMMSELSRPGSFSLKSRITHSIFIAFFIFFCGHKIADEKAYFSGYSLLLVMGIVNLFFIVQGRTGQLVFLVLVILFALQRLSKKGILAAVLTMTVFMMLFLNFSDKSSRVREGITNTAIYLRSHDKKSEAGVAIRYKFWESALKLIDEKPLFGHGTGGFGAGYSRVSGNKLDIKNPHNEFLMMAVQFGVVGLAVYIGFLFSLYSDAKKMAESEKWLAQGVLGTLIVTSLFNSPFLDHAEGHWFAVMIALCFGNVRNNNNLIQGDSE